MGWLVWAYWFICTWYNNSDKFWISGNFMLPYQSTKYVLSKKIWILKSWHHPSFIPSLNDYIRPEYNHVFLNIIKVCWTPLCIFINRIDQVRLLCYFKVPKRLNSDIKWSSDWFDIQGMVMLVLVLMKLLRKKHNIS